MNDFVLSLLPELGTMGSKWGGAGVTRSSTSYRVDEQRMPDEDYSQYKVIDFDDAWVGTYTIILE